MSDRRTRELGARPVAVGFGVGASTCAAVVAVSFLLYGASVFWLLLAIGLGFSAATVAMGDATRSARRKAADDAREVRDHPGAE
jgi:hypothetical protein